MSQETFARVVGNATLHLWPDLPRDTQEKLFEVAVGTDDALRHHLAVFLHEHHPRTAHPPKPTALAQKGTGPWSMYILSAPEGAAGEQYVEDFFIEDHAANVLQTSQTQREAIDWAKHAGHTPLVARVRHFNDKKKPDYWSDVMISQP